MVTQDGTTRSVPVGSVLVGSLRLLPRPTSSVTPPQAPPAGPSERLPHTRRGVFRFCRSFHQENRMAKRSTRVAAQPRVHDGKITALFPAWDPTEARGRDGDRDQSYVRKVRPQGDN